MTAPLSPAVFPQKVDAAHRIFQAVLGPTTPDKVFLERQVTISDDGRRLYEHTANNRLLAEAVLGADFPRVAGPADLEHYTPFAGLRGVVTSKQLHLYPVARYLHQHEFATFAREHDLDGYFDLNDRGQQVLEELSKDLFFVSMTRPGNPDEDMLWQTFADDGRGVRLRMRVTPRPPADLRIMNYQTGSPTALKRINDYLRAKLELVYTPWTISRICAFYLTLGYRPEREVRLMLKRHEGGPDRTTTSGQHEIWPVPLATPGGTTGNEWCEIELVEITAGPRCSSAAVQNLLAGSVYAGVPVS